MVFCHHSRAGTHLNRFSHPAFFIGYIYCHLSNHFCASFLSIMFNMLDCVGRHLMQVWNWLVQQVTLWLKNLMQGLLLNRWWLHNLLQLFWIFSINLWLPSKALMVIIWLKAIILLVIIYLFYLHNMSYDYRIPFNLLPPWT
jgi:hypothetical protein